MESTRKVAQSQDVAIDPNFFLPPNVVDLRYVSSQDYYDVPTDESQDEETTEDGLVSEPEGDLIPVDLGGTSVLNPPTNITIVSQTVRVLGGGGYVVDVVIEVEDVDNALSYETRISK